MINGFHVWTCNTLSHICDLLNIWISLVPGSIQFYHRMCWTNLISIFIHFVTFSYFAILVYALRFKICTLSWNASFKLEIVPWSVKTRNAWLKFISRINKLTPVKVFSFKIWQKNSATSLGVVHITSRLGKVSRRRMETQFFTASGELWSTFNIRFNPRIPDMTSHHSQLTRRVWASSRSRRTAAWVWAFPTTTGWTLPTTRDRPSQPAPRTAFSSLTMKQASSLWKDSQIR